MPSQKILDLKKQQVAELKEKVASSVAGVLVDYRGISAGDDTKLRKELREAGVEYTVVKNTILHLTFEGTDYAELDSVLTGTTALALSKEDHTAAARILGKFAEGADGYFNLKGGFLDGKVIDVATVNALAKLPSREVLLATVCNVLNAPIAALARAVNAVVEKGGATAEAATEVPAEAAPAAEAEAPAEPEAPATEAEAPAETPAE